MSHVQPNADWWDAYVGRVNAACDRLGLQKDDGTHVHPVAARAATEHDGAGFGRQMEDGTMDARAIVEQAGLQQAAADPAKAQRTAQALIQLAGAMGDQASVLKDEDERDAAMEAERMCLSLSEKAQALATLAEAPRAAEHAGILAATALFEMGRYQDALSKLEEVKEALAEKHIQPGRAWRSERAMVLKQMTA